MAVLAAASSLHILFLLTLLGYFIGSPTVLIVIHLHRLHIFPSCLLLLLHLLFILVLVLLCFLGRHSSRIRSILHSPLLTRP